VEQVRELLKKSSKHRPVEVPGDPGDCGLLGSLFVGETRGLTGLLTSLLGDFLIGLSVRRLGTASDLIGETLARWRNLVDGDLVLLRVRREDDVDNGELSL